MYHQLQGILQTLPVGNAVTIATWHGSCNQHWNGHVSNVYIDHVSRMYNGYLRSFNSSINTSRWYLVSLSKQFEVIDQSLHWLLSIMIQWMAVINSNWYTFISDLLGGDILWSSTLTSPSGILFKHCTIIVYIHMIWCSVILL